MSDAEREAWKRYERVQARKRSNTAHLKRIKESAAVEHYDMKMKDDCRVKAKTAQALHYLDEAHRVRRRTSLTAFNPCHIRLH